MKTIPSIIRVGLAIGALAGFMLVTTTARAAEPDKKTLRTFKAKCSSCHGEDGKAQTEQGKKMAIRDWTSAEFWKDTSDAKIKEAIEKGVKTDKGGKKQEMDAFAAKLKPEEIDNLTAYVKTFKKQ